MATYHMYSDFDLIPLLKNSDQDAYIEIYSRYIRALTRFAESKLYSLEDARDIIQDIFTNLWSERHTIDIHDSLKSYLFGIAKYQIINKIRKNIVREEYADRLKRLSPAYHSLDDELNARELNNNILSKLDELPEKTRYIYHCSRSQNMSIKQIAEELDLSDQTVKNQISMALKHLKKSLPGFLLLFL